MVAENRLHEQLRAFLAERAVEGYVVGGYVRDLLLGRPNNDLDVAVAGDAVALARAFSDAIGGHFVLLDPVNVIARVVPYSGSLYVDFTRLQGGRLEADLALRDLTINALAFPVADLGGRPQIIDPCGGQADMHRRLVRAVSDDAFWHDPARLLRAARFAAQLDYAIEPHTAELIGRDASLLARVAGERARDEFVRLLVAPGAWAHLRLLDELGLLSTLLPELDELRGAQQPAVHEYDVFTHTLAVVDAVEVTLAACQIAYEGRRPPGPPHPALPQGVLGAVAEPVRGHMHAVLSADRTRICGLKLAALFHDIAKPRTRTVDADGAIHFYDHPQAGLDMTVGALRRLRFSSNEVQTVSTIVAHHMRPAQLASEPQVTQRAVYRYFRDTGATGIDTLLHSLADHIGTRGPRLDVQEWWRHAQFTRLMLEQYYARPERTTKPHKLLSGADIIRIFRLPAGPRVGQLIEELREAQVMELVHTREQAIAFVRERLAELPAAALSADAED